MKKFVTTSIFILLISTSCLAQEVTKQEVTKQESPATPSQKACEVMYQREVQLHKTDLILGIQLDMQVADLKKQVADLTKERDDLKSKITTPEVSEIKKP